MIICVINLFSKVADILFMPNHKNAEKLSKVKALILSRLSKKEWVKSSELLNLTGQKYFDRRIRELRNEMGYDIETGFIDGEPSYRLRSDKRSQVKPRTYLNAADKKTLLKGSDGKCAICGNEFTKRNPLSFDHRVPLLRGGSGSIDNFQLVCYECNNQKRVQCKSCELDCQRCFLAFPDKLPKGILLQLSSKSLANQLADKAKKDRKSVEEYLLSLIKKALK